MATSSSGRMLLVARRGAVRCRHGVGCVCVSRESTRTERACAIRGSFVCVSSGKREKRRMLGEREREEKIKESAPQCYHNVAIAHWCNFGSSRVWLVGSPRFACVGTTYLAQQPILALRVLGRQAPTLCAPRYGRGGERKDVGHRNCSTTRTPVLELRHLLV